MIIKTIAAVAVSLIFAAVCVWIAVQCIKDFREYWREFVHDFRKDARYRKGENHE